MSSYQLATLILSVDNINRQGRIFPDIGFRQDVLLANGQPVKVGFDITQFAVFRGSRMRCARIGGLEDTDTILFFQGDNIIFFEGLGRQTTGVGNLLDFFGGKLNQNCFINTTF